MSGACGVDDPAKQNRVGTEAKTEGDARDPVPESVDAAEADGR